MEHQTHLQDSLDFDLSQRNIRIYDVVYVTGAVLSETFAAHKEDWLGCWSILQSCEPKRLPCAKGVGELSALLTEGAFTEATKSACAGDRIHRSHIAEPCRLVPFLRCTGKWG